MCGVCGVGYHEDGREGGEEEDEEEEKEEEEEQESPKSKNPTQRCGEQGQFVNVELVMLYLHSRGLLHEVVIVPLFNLVNATDTRSKETEIIQTWRPVYNHPWINKLHPTSTFRTTKLAINCFKSYHKIFQIMEESETKTSVGRHFTVLCDIIGITFFWLGQSYDVSGWRTVGI